MSLNITVKSGDVVRVGEATLQIVNRGRGQLLLRVTAPSTMPVKRMGKGPALAEVCDP